MGAAPPKCTHYHRHISLDDRHRVLDQNDYSNVQTKRLFFFESGKAHHVGCQMTHHGHELLDDDGTVLANILLALK